MAVKWYQVHVVRAGVKEDGLVLVNCTSRSDVWHGARWWVVPHTNPGASAFLATALTCVSTGLPAKPLGRGNLAGVRRHHPALRRTSLKHAQHITPSFVNQWALTQSLDPTPPKLESNATTSC